MLLNRFYAHNYKTLVNFEWHPPAVSALVGPNGSGKSAVVSARGALQDLLSLGASIDEVGFPATRTAWLDEPDQSIEIHAFADVEADVDGQPFAHELFRYKLGLHLEGKRASLREELHAGGDLLFRSHDGAAELYGDTPAPEPRAAFQFDRKRSFLAALEPRRDNRRITAFKRFVDAIWIIQPDPPRILGVAPREEAWLDRTLENFAGWYRGRIQEDPDALEQMRRALQKAVDGFDTLQFETGTGTRDLLVRFAFSGKKHVVRFDALSEGQRLLVALYALLVFGVPRAKLLVLDEVENYVAPAEIQPWFRAMLDAMQAHRAQTIAISHHPEVINYVAADSAWRMFRDPTTGHSRIEPLAPDLDAGERAYDLVRDLPSSG